MHASLHQLGFKNVESIQPLFERELDCSLKNDEDFDPAEWFEPEVILDGPRLNHRGPLGFWEEVRSLCFANTPIGDRLLTIEENLLFVSGLEGKSSDDLRPHCMEIQRISKLLGYDWLSSYLARAVKETGFWLTELSAN